MTFDPHRGWGVLRSDDGTEFFFHCVDIANGTRFIAPNTRVQGRRTVGHRGHDEVTDVTEIRAN